MGGLARISFSRSKVRIKIGELKVLPVGLNVDIDDDRNAIHLGICEGDHRSRDD